MNGKMTVAYWCCPSKLFTVACWAVLILMVAMAATPSLAITPIDHSVQLSAQTQKSPPAITLNWVINGTPSSCTVSKRNAGQTGSAWTTVVTLAPSATTYTDTDVVVGARYEYKVKYTSTAVTAYGYIYAGIEVPLTENRGKLILVVDITIRDTLASELGRLTQDLTGDGWVIIRHDVGRDWTSAQVKSIIKANYDADPSNVKSVFLFGHVPLEMSANMSPDGHNSRPWPADAYYGEMDGMWYDGRMSTMNSPMELQVGRVDLWNLPTFAPLTETDLLRRYLNKDHSYRQKQYAIAQNALVDDDFGEWGTEAFAQNAWTNFTPFVGVGKVSAGTWGAPATPSLWFYGCGPGTYTGCGGVCWTVSMKTTDPAVFTFLFGSFFGQWDYTDDLLRAALATPKYVLTCAWSGRPHWYVHHMAMGEPIGYSTLRTMNNVPNEYDPSVFSTWIFPALMGDPSLRAFMAGPPGTLAAVPDEVTGAVDLSWGASADTVLGYYVYRSDQPYGPYTRITDSYVAGTTYRDNTAPVGNQYFMVRAIALQTTPSGSYYNASQGVFANCEVPYVQIPTNGIKLWLKGNIGVTKDAAGLVSSWTDLTGNGNDVTQPISSKEPVHVANVINGRPVVRFGGGDDDVLASSNLLINGASPFTTVAYVRPETTGSMQTIFRQGDASSTGGYGAYLSGTVDVKAGWGGSSSEITSSDSAAWHLVVTTYNLATHKMWVNGALAGTAQKNDSSFTSGVFSLGNSAPGANQGFSGDIAEVLVYDHALSDPERVSVETYLKGKYGKPVAAFVTTPEVGLVPLTVTFDASGSVDPDGSLVLCSWDFGDHTTGAGMVTNHVYGSAGTYTATLTATDNDGHTDTTTWTVTVMPSVSSVSLSGNPATPVGVGTPVTITAAVVGGYRVLYRFEVNYGTGWQMVRDYDLSTTFVWTPVAVGSYQFRVYARSTDSGASYDALSNPTTYIVAHIPINGLRLWLRADSGVARSGNVVTGWTDQSGYGSVLIQDDVAVRPSIVDNAVNGRSVIRFAGPNQMLQTASSVLSAGTSFTTFTVGRLDQIPGSSQYFWWNGASTQTGGYGCMLHLSGSIRNAWGSGSGSLTDSGAAQTNTWYRIVSRFNGSTHEMWVNGASAGTKPKTGSSLSSSFSVGNYSPSPGSGLYGDIGEIVIYDRVLTDTERTNVEGYLSNRWTPVPPVHKDRLADVKALGDGVYASIMSAKVATVASGVFSDGSIYLEEPDKSTGMKVFGASGIALWNNITLTGNVVVDSNGQKVFLVSSVDSNSVGTEVGALGMSNKSLTASGQLVRVWGKVVSKTDTYISIDDGSGAPGRVRIDGLSTPLTKVINAGDYVSVTGPAGIMVGSVQCVRPRCDTDIRVY